MTKKSRIIGFGAITTVWIAFLVMVFMTQSRETWAYLMGYGVPVIGYVSLLILFVLLIEIIEFVKYILNFIKTPVEQRPSIGKIIRDHYLLIFLTLLVLWVLYTGLSGPSQFK